MKPKILLATSNKNKVSEIKEMLGDLPVDFLSINDMGEVPFVVEDGTTFKNNAVKKAITLAKFTGMHTLADDSGLEVDFLKGAPGIHSARFNGEASTALQKNKKVLELLDGANPEQRSARFVCAAAFATPAGEIFTTRGTCKGKIALEAAGARGFGYDPIFIIPSYKKTLAELGPEIKNKISHRAKAMHKMKKIFMKVFHFPL